MLEAAYAIAFYFLLLCYIVDALRRSFIDRSPTSWEWAYRVGVTLFVSLQLLKMYYYLHEFEVEIAKPGISHFLELIKGNRRVWERAVRAFLAFVLVVFSKIDTSRSWFVPQLTESTDAGRFSPQLTAGITAMISFCLLLCWDSIVWRGLKFYRDANRIDNSAWQTAQEFFHLEANCRSPTELGCYLRTWKFWERACGLLAAASALVYIRWPRPEWVAALIFFALCTFIIYLLAMIFTQSESSAQKVREASARLARLLVDPIITLHQCLWGSQMDNEGKRSRLWLFVGAGFILLLVAAIGLVWRGKTPIPTALREPMRIRVATSKNLWCALTLIADKQGYFGAEGLDPQMNYQAAGRLNMDALLGGAADFANVVETNIAYQALNQTPNLAILGRIVSATDYAILTKKSASIQQPKGLRGKRLAYAQATGAESFVFWFLEKEGIPASALTLVPLQPAGLVDHFLGEPTEAVATWEPFVSTIRSRLPELGPTFQTDSTGFAGIMTVATLRSYAQQHPAVVVAYEHAMEKSARFLGDTPSEAQRIVAEQAGLPIETVHSIWNRFDFRYVESTSGEAALIEQVIRRIRANLPELAGRAPADVNTYFAPVR